MEDWTPRDLEKLPEHYRYLRDHIDQPRMQFIVALGVAGGLGVGNMIYDAYVSETPMTEEEEEAKEKVPKFLGGLLLFAGIYYLLDIDSKWWNANEASLEAEKWLGANF